MEAQALSFLVLAIFTLAHVASKWQDRREQDRAARVAPCGLWLYVKVHAPAKTLLAVLSSVGLGLTLQWMEALNPLTAVTAGWSANSMIDHLVKRGRTLVQ